MLESWQFPRGKSRVSDEERGVTGIEQLSSNSAHNSSPAPLNSRPDAGSNSISLTPNHGSGVGTSTQATPTSSGPSSTPYKSSGAGAGIQATPYSSETHDRLVDSALPQPPLPSSTTHKSSVIGAGIPPFPYASAPHNDLGNGAGTQTTSPLPTPSQAPYVTPRSNGTFLDSHQANRCQEEPKSLWQNSLKCLKVLYWVLPIWMALSILLIPDGPGNTTSMPIKALPWFWGLWGFTFTSLVVRAIIQRGYTCIRKLIGLSLLGTAYFIFWRPELLALRVLPLLLTTVLIIEEFYRFRFVS